LTTPLAGDKTLVAPGPPDFKLPPTIASFPSPVASEPHKSRVPIYVLGGFALIVVAGLIASAAIFLYYGTRQQNSNQTTLATAPLKFADGTRYEGGVRDGVPDGRGIMIFPNGSTYDGEFSDGKRNGKGVFTFGDGTSYTGQFKNDVYEGNGVVRFFNKDVYEGQFVNGKYHGQGTFTYHDGRKQQGTWVEGKFVGP
jgi:hypothetical protein